MAFGYAYAVQYPPLGRIPGDVYRKTPGVLFVVYGFVWFSLFSRCSYCFHRRQHATPTETKRFIT